MQNDFFTNNVVKKPDKLLKLRIPYKGSKIDIASQLIDKMLEVKPNAKYFIDMCGGGGAMSFTAKQYGLQVLYNEKQTGVVNLLQFILDRMKNNEKSELGFFPLEFYNFVSRQEFKELIKQDTAYSEFVRINYSFSNNQRNYMFSPELEKFKKQGHNFVMYKDRQAKEYIKEHYKTSCNRFIDYIETGKTWQDRRLLYVNIILKIEAIKVAESCYDGFVNFFDSFINEGFHKMSNVYIVNLINEYIPNIDRKHYKTDRSAKLKELKQLQQLKRLEQLEQLQQLERLKQLQHLERPDLITLSNLDYKDVVINTPHEETIVYFDPPYRDTDKYSEEVNHEELDNYFKNSPYSCFMSEYTAPHKSIYQIQKISKMLNNVVDKLYKTENLFYNEK